jgi:hypothetical protein
MTWRVRPPQGDGVAEREELMKLPVRTSPYKRHHGHLGHNVTATGRLCTGSVHPDALDRAAHPPWTTTHRKWVHRERGGRPLAGERKRLALPEDLSL